MIKDRAGKKNYNHDVAREAEVSISTVSHVLNGTAKNFRSNPAACNRYCSAVQLCMPNGYGLKVRDKGSKVLGLWSQTSKRILCKVRTVYYEHGLQENYTTMICEMAFNYKRNVWAWTRFWIKVDGIIFIGGSMDGNIIRKAKQISPGHAVRQKITGYPCHPLQRTT